MKIWFLPKGCGNVIATTRVINVCALLVAFFFFDIGICKGQSTELEFSSIPFSEPDIVAPGRGAEQWHNASLAIPNPAENLIQTPLDVYYRFTWNRLEGPGQDEYHWSYFDGLVKDAINRGQKLSFGIMSCYPQGSNSPGVLSYDNGDAAYPEYLHQLMQNENYPDWRTSGSGPTDGYGSWVPNWNSPNYLGRLRALHEALYAHINSTSYTAQAGPVAGKTIAFKDAIFSIDIRGYGSWGEWHSGSIIRQMSNYPQGTAPTAQTLKTIIDNHADVFTDHPLSLMISVFDGEWLSNTYTPKEVGAYALQRSNNWGPFGWRRDNWGATDDYLDTYLRDNLKFWGTSGPFNALIMERWKSSPITGEPPGWVASLNGDCYYDDLERQIREYHATSLGNGNYGMYDLPDCARENLRNAFKAAGYRIVLENGSISSNPRAGGNLAITLNWKNIGIAPTYENWDVVFELKDNENTTIWSATSSYTPGKNNENGSLIPSPDATQATDNFTLPTNIIAGDYRLNLIIKDPSGYRAPLPLAIQGRNDDGSYTLKNIFVAEATDEEVPATPPPTVPPPATDDSCQAIEATISSTGGCDGQALSIVLANATGEGPYDLVVNGIKYNNVSVGNAFASATGGADESIWNNTPSTNTYIDRAVELGVKFTSSENGYIKGIRFFSANIVAGTYTGHLWTNDGTLLANAEFSNVTANGWQQILFEVPVAVTAGTIYVASYYNSAGIYAATSRGLTNAVTNGQSITALGGNIEGGNGVYSYDGPYFPTQTYNATNYWVDVVFARSAQEFNFTSITGNNGCTTSGSLQTFVASAEPCIQQQRSGNASTAVIAKSAPVIDVKDGPNTNELKQNYPNPFTDGTVITYRLAKAGNVKLGLYDLNGKLLKILVNANKEAGEHTTAMRAGELAAGVYFYRIQSGNYSATKKMIIQ
jgi:hypothetical protein